MREKVLQTWTSRFVSPAGTLASTVATPAGSLEDEAVPSGMTSNLLLPID
jgi:hypothetical protein